MSPAQLEAELEALLSESLGTVMLREQQSFDHLTAPHGRDIVLFGAGRLGRKALLGLRRIGLEPLAFCDNNPALQGSTIDGVPVESPQQAASRFGATATFVVTIWGPHDRDTMAERIQSLLDLGCHSVVPFSPLFWSHPEAFGPYYAFDIPSRSVRQAEGIRRASRLWADDASRSEYLRQIKWRLSGDFGVLSDPVNHEVYFPLDLVDLMPAEVFVDCGAYDGDTIRSLLRHPGVTRPEVVAFEPDGPNFERLKQWVASLPMQRRQLVRLHQSAVGSRRAQVAFDSSGTEASTVGEGTTLVDVVPLDEVLSGQSPTYIKMDIEGSELDALRGGAAAIKRSLPVLAICVYHHFDHPWRIPVLIADLSDEYAFYLRPHQMQAWDLVCYAIPRRRLKQQPAVRS